MYAYDVYAVHRSYEHVIYDDDVFMIAFQSSRH